MRRRRRVTALLSGDATLRAVSRPGRRASLSSRFRSFVFVSSRRRPFSRERARRDATRTEPTRSFAARVRLPRTETRFFSDLSDYNRASRSFCVPRARRTLPTSPFLARAVCLFITPPPTRTTLRGRYTGRRLAIPARARRAGSLFRSCTPLCRFPFARLSR